MVRRRVQLTHLKVHGQSLPDAPAAWKLNNCTLLVDQSVRFSTVACLQKAQSFDNQTSEFVVSLEDKQLILQQIFPVMREMGG